MDPDISREVIQQPVVVPPDTNETQTQALFKGPFLRDFSLHLDFENATLTRYVINTTSFSNYYDNGHHFDKIQETLLHRNR